MNVASFLEDISWNEDKPAIKVMLETSATKEIRIAMRKGQNIKEHKTPFPIVVEIVSGKLNFGVEGKTHTFTPGQMIGLEANVPHDLTAQEESVVRLSLSKFDSVERVQQV